MSIRTQRTRTATAAFTLIELVITMLIIAILAGVVSTRLGGMAEKARAAKVLSLVTSLETAAEHYVADTGQMPREEPENGNNGDWMRLSFDPGVSGWNGPYLKRPLSRASHPTGEDAIYLRPGVASAACGGNGMDLQGDGVADIAADDWWESCVLHLYNVEQQVAEQVDAAIDGNIGGTWSDAGSVEYHGTTLAIVIYWR